MVLDGLLLRGFETRSLSVAEVKYCLRKERKEVRI